jgi:hypothetical protein
MSLALAQDVVWIVHFVGAGTLKTIAAEQACTFVYENVAARSTTHTHEGGWSDRLATRRLQERSLSHARIALKVRAASITSASLTSNSKPREIAVVADADATGLHVVRYPSTTITSTTIRDQACRKLG